MMFKVLGKINWDNIKNGEVFALKGCWQIAYKINDNKVICLATDGVGSDERNGQILTIITAKCYMWTGSVKEGMTIAGENGQLYKLPLEVQNLFITK